MKRRWVLLLVMTAFVRLSCFADEGMWIPILLKKYNIEEMQRKGFKLTAEDIYDINKASLKDAVIGLAYENRPFAHFCTGNLISADGLMITNHHCAFSMIQAHSSLERNYLRDGFWAKNRSEELANPGVTASVLVRMEDVTDKITQNLREDMSEKERNGVIHNVSEELIRQAIQGTNLQANIKPYFNGNQFFMSVFKIYKDVRLVGAPPSSIGKFGGDTDNWVWPRHTGDFAVLRLYADTNNEPASYSANNKPYKPATFFKISIKGVQEGDFTMVFGYPGTTMEYLTSFAVNQIKEVENPHKVAIRTVKLNIINAAMESDELLRIKYAAKAANVANGWKKWQGEIKGLKRFHTIESKQKLEQEFQRWAVGQKRYNGLIDRYRELYNKREAFVLAASYLNEAGRRGAEIFGLASVIYKSIEEQGKKIGLDTLKQLLKEYCQLFYKDYDTGTDQKIFVEMMKLYNQNLPVEWIPSAIAEIRKKGDYEGYAKRLFKKSLFTDPERIQEFVNKLGPNTMKRLQKDPVWQLANIMDIYYAEKIEPEWKRIENEIAEMNRIWLEGLMKMQPDKVFYPDANSTLRVAYGKVGGYSPYDAVYYKHYTTLGGIIEKDNPAIYDYDVPQKLRNIYTSKDFGPYTQNGEIPVCFIADNHTTGGNSGSPVLNAEGYLIGLNFDRAWDGVMSDIQYNPEICRNISVDIRYVLFIMDKLAGANNLISEMEIVK